MQEPPDPGGTPNKFYQCIKTSLKSVVRDDTVIAKLDEAALRANGIVTHTLQQLKLYLMHCFDNGTALSTIDRQFVTSVMKVLCEEPRRGRPPNENNFRLKENL